MIFISCPNLASKKGRLFKMGEYIMTLIWAAIFVTVLIVESQTAELVAIWFLPGAVISMILSLFDVAEWIQWLVFVMLSAILLFLAFKFFRKLLLKNEGNSKTDTDLLIGRQARVEESIINSEMKGAVKIDGKVWSARMISDEETAEIGEFVTVESIAGVKLICKK